MIERRRVISDTERLFDENDVPIGTEFLIAVWDVPMNDPPAARLVGAEQVVVLDEQVREPVSLEPGASPEKVAGYDAKRAALLRPFDTLDPSRATYEQERVAAEQTFISRLVSDVAAVIEHEDRKRSWPLERFSNSSSSLPDRRG